MKACNGSKNDLSILIVLYSCNMEDSVSLKSIFKYKKELSNNFNVNLVVWNNGPNKIDGDMLSLYREMNCFFYETIENESLAKIYNKFIVYFSTSYYMFLDHDTELTLSYIKSLSRLKSKFVSIPIVYSNESVVYPQTNVDFLNKSEVCIKENDEFTSITSGVVIPMSVIEKFLKSYTYIFDERFYLYGVDSTFFINLLRLNVNVKLNILGGIVHSLSRFEFESKDNIKMRVKERSFSFGMICRYYEPFPLSFFKLIKLTIITVFGLGNPNFNIITVWRAYLNGRHFRDSNKCVSKLNNGKNML